MIMTNGLATRMSWELRRRMPDVPPFPIVADFGGWPGLAPCIAVWSYNDAGQCHAAFTRDGHLVSLSAWSWPDAEDGWTVTGDARGVHIVSEYKGPSDCVVEIGPV